MVLPQHVEQLLWRGSFGESRKAAKVRKEARDVRAVPRQEPFPLFARDQVRHLRGDEARELRTLPFDCLDQARVCQRDRSLVGERLNERDVTVRERLRLTTHHDDHTDEIVFKHDRHSEHRPEEPRPRIRVLGVRQDVGYLNRLSLDGRAAGRSRPVERVRMLLVVPHAVRLAIVCAQMEELTLEKPQGPVVSVAESPACFRHLAQNGL